MVDELPPSAKTTIEDMYARLEDVATVIVVTSSTALVAVKVSSPVLAGGDWVLPIVVEPAVTLNVPVSEPYCLAVTFTVLTSAAEDKVRVI